MAGVKTGRANLAGVLAPLRVVRLAIQQVSSTGVWRGAYLAWCLVFLSGAPFGLVAACALACATTGALRIAVPSA